MKKLIMTEYFGIIVLLVALIPQIAHTVYVFKINSHYPEPWFAWCYAIGVDLAILIFTVRGWIWTAVAYLMATLAHNIAYQFFPQSDISSILIGITLSATIFSFSHIFYSGSKKRNESADDDALIDLGKRIESAVQSGIHIEAHPYLCPCCGLTFPTSKKLNGHISGHKMKGEWDEDKYGDWKHKNNERSSLLSELGLDLKTLGAKEPIENQSA
ncbi:hypothetical protein QQ008_07320 [Fulvivirgaceae bacterium BMA10]|uniref:C2H2-type domain-containing protein n=1 Tax=Splendidivirga corallicola TaxID=3051826 RepID=A0ABT8KLQ3_9BACT|nr:hypothetical protein [Fulvivirgaceae bacterium BMA10]